MDKPNIPWYKSYFLILMMLNRRRTSCVIYKLKALDRLLSPQTFTIKYSQENSLERMKPSQKPETEPPFLACLQQY